MPTSNYAIPLYTTSDTAALDTLLNGQSNALDAALLATEGFTIGTDAQRVALGTPRRKEGLKWYATDTNITWHYTGSAWQMWNTPWANLSLAANWAAANTQYRLSEGALQVSPIYAWRITSSLTVTGGTFYTLGTLPTGYRPGIDITGIGGTLRMTGVTFQPDWYINSTTGQLQFTSLSGDGTFAVSTGTISNHLSMSGFTVSV
jgi:hypothetical protein